MSSTVQPVWVALADGGPVAALGLDRPATQLRVVRDGAVFKAILCTGRPHVAILTAPLAPDDVLATALRERRRRTSLRLLHVSPVEAVTWVAALRSGFDDAVPDTIDPLELEARLELLDGRARTRQAPVIAVAEGVVIDPVAHEVPSPR
jgi:DNA-binding response OmpR family regulator